MLGRDRSFTWYWVGNAISVIGSAVTIVVLPLLVYQITESPVVAGLLFSAGTIGYIGFALFAGVLADSVDRRRLLIGCNLVSAALTGSIPIAQAFGALTIAQIFVVTFLVSVAGMLFTAASFGAVVALVGRDRILGANSSLGVAESMAGLIGPAIGGVLATTIGPANAVLVVAISFLIGAACLLLVTRPLGGGRVARSGSIVRRTAADIGEGLRFIVRQPIVRVQTVLGVFNSFATGIIIGQTVVYGVRALGLATDDARIGLLYAASGVGALAGNLLLPRLKIPAGWMSLIALATGATAMAGMAAAPALAAGLAMVTLWAVARTFVIVNSLTMRQQVTPDDLMGRVNAAGRMLALSGQPVGALVGGLVAEAFSVRAALTLAALVVAVALLIGLASPLRRVERPAVPDR